MRATARRPERLRFRPPVGVAALLVLLAAGCESGGASPAQIPLPVPAAELPPDDTASVYYYLSVGNDTCGYGTDCENFLRSLVEAGFEIRDVWSPGGPTPCECLSCHQALIVRLLGPDDRITDFGMKLDPGFLVVTCGIEFLLYDFRGPTPRS